MADGSVARLSLDVGQVNAAFDAHPDPRAAQRLLTEPPDTPFLRQLPRAAGGPFVLFALAPLFAGLFIERSFCRYLCPLGAALAIPARIRMFAA